MTTHSILTTLGESSMHRLWFGKEADSAIGRDTDDLYMFILWVCIISFLIVMGMMIAFVIKYRRRPAGAASGYQVSPGHNTPLELAWSIIPLLVMVVIFFWGFAGYVNKVAAPPGAEEIWITGRQWSWSARYANGKEATDVKLIGNRESPIIYVPTGRPVKLIMASTDVIHSFFIPAMRTKMDVFPNRYTSFWFQAEKAGEDHEFTCAEYCGKDHSEMAGWIRTMTPEAFDEWKAKEEPLDPNPCIAGRKLWRNKGCASCHTLDGGAGTGPSWKNMFGHGVEFTSGEPLSDADMSDSEKFANYIRESILNPQAKIVKGFGPQMNSFQGQIREDQIQAIIAFLKCPDMTDRPAPQPAAAPADAAGKPAAAPAPASAPTPQAPTTPAPK